MKKDLLLAFIFLPSFLFSQSFLLQKVNGANILSITNIESNEVIILDSVFNFTLESYTVKDKLLECIIESGERKYYDISMLSLAIIKKKNFKHKTDNDATVNYLVGESELIEIDFNMALCVNNQKKWEIINSKKRRRPECKSERTDYNKGLSIFGHPVLSNKQDFFIYNLERWNWLSSFYKTYEVDVNTGKQTKLYNGLNTQISPTDRYLLYNDLKKRYFIYDRKTKEKTMIIAKKAFWIYDE